MAKIYVEAHGCAASYADSELVSGVLQSGGHTLVPRQEDSDAGILVTCSVKDATASKMIHRIKSMSDKPLVVAGCMPKAEERTVARLADTASMIGPQTVGHALEAVNAVLSGTRVVRLEGNEHTPGLPRVRLNPAVSIVQIAQGCMSECSFCQTKLAKGDLVSYRVGDIVRQIRHDIEDGCCEVWLSSTDNGCYGFDIGTDLPALINAASDVPGDYMIRVGMMNPMFMHRIRDSLIRSYCSKKVYKFLHLPVQSGSNRVLADMRRGHTAQIFQDTVRRFRLAHPDITISTDVIVGFPGETDSEFEETLGLVQDTKPDMVNMSKYSARPGTEAADMAQTPPDVIRRRSRALHDLCARISLESGMAQIGKRRWVTFSEYAKRGVRGRDSSYRPVHVHDNVTIGQRLHVTITDATVHGLVAEPV